MFVAIRALRVKTNEHEKKKRGGLVGSIFLNYFACKLTLVPEIT